MGPKKLQDSERPLTTEGSRRVLAGFQSIVATCSKSLNRISSPFKRTMQTAEILQKVLF
ncbi:MAG: hypothetical protein R2877_05165 [Bdellovibrionota bacterium]